MVLYEELKRHTPPPPPYSLCKSDTANIKSANEASQPLAPAPPPPYLTSALKSECTIPSINELRTQVVALDDSYLFRNGNTIPLPLVPPRRSAAGTLNSQQSFEDPSGIWNHSWSCLRVPAHPVEPKWVPVGTIGCYGLPLVGATAPLPKFPQEGSGHSTPQSFSVSTGTRIRPGHVDLSSRSPFGHNAASCVTQPPKALSTMTQQPQPTSRRQSSKDVASLANITSDATTSFEPSNTMYPLSALPSKQVHKKRTALTAVPTPQELDAVENVPCVTSMPDANEDSCSDGDSGDEDGKYTSAVPALHDHNSASPAWSEYDRRPSKDDIMSRGRDRGHQVSHSDYRRPSVVARFEPYKRC